MSRQAKIDVTINGEQATQRLNEIKEDLKQIKALRDKAAAEGDVKGYAQLNNEMKKLTREANKLEQATFDVKAVLNNLSGASIRDIETALRLTNRELKAMKQNDAGFKQKEAEAKQLRNELDRLQGKTKETGLNFGKIADGFNKYFGMAAAFVATFTGVIFGFRKASEEFNAFEKRVDNLSALTGLVGDDLEYLTQKAKELSTETIEGNIRITKSADAIVDAYTKVGSKRPELLQNKEALKEVTQEAMILAAAADGELDPAVDALTMTLNQFNVQAGESRRIINTLAAGSKFGAGNIPYLTTAIEKSGTVAADANISIEELVGTIETLAPRMTAPEQAGTGLRNVILKLQQSTKDVNPAIQGLLPALDNLAKKNLSVAEMSKLVGLENITVLKILMNNREELANYTNAVTGTSTALEQAAINTDNNASKLDQARNKAALMRIELGEKLSPVITFSTNAFSYLAKAILATIEYYQENRTVILSTMSAVAAYTVVVYGAAAAKKIYTIAVNVATAAVKAFNLASKSSPFGFIAGGLAFIATFWITLRSEISKTSKEQKVFNDIQAETKRRTVEEAGEMRRLFDAVRDQNTSQEVRKELIKKINEKYKDYLPNLLDEKSSLVDINTAYTNVNKALREKIEFMVKEAKAKEIYLQIYELEMEYQRIAALSAAQYNKENGIVEGVRGAARSRALQNLKKDMNELTSVYDKIMKDINVVAPEQLINSTIDNDDTKDDGGGDDDEKAKTAYERLSETLTKAKKKLEDLVAANKFAEAAIAGGVVKTLENQLQVVNAIIKAGGNVDKFLQDLTDSTEGELQEQQEIWEKFNKEFGKQAEEYEKKQQEIELERSESRTGFIVAMYENFKAQEEEWQEWVERGQYDFYMGIAEKISAAKLEIKRHEIDNELKLTIDSLNSQMEHELANKRLTEEQRAKIREKYQAKEKDAQREAWEKQHKADLAEAYINMALSIGKAAINKWPLPAVPLMAMAAVEGGAQIAVISRQKNPYRAGGYTSTSLSDDTAVGEVHANEFVGNADAVRNPSVKQIFDIIDYAQRAGTIKSLNLPAIIAQSNKQMKAGGYASGSNDAVTSPAVSPAASPQAMITALNRFSDVIDRLQANGIEARGKWVYQDFKKIADKESSAINDSM